MSPLQPAASPHSVDPTASIQLLLGVSRLGEADLAGWWSSQGMNPAVRFTLAGFRRTSQTVGAELALLSASRRHRQILPRPTAVHLFSPHLPFAAWTRAYLAEQKTSEEGWIIEELLTWTTSAAARAHLRTWCEAVPTPPRDAPTVSRADLDDPTVAAGLLVRFAGGYVAQEGDLAVPYVDLVA